MHDLINNEYIEINQEQYKKKVIDVLIEFHNFCENEGLTYFLGFGTLLGAIRHKGFIPWDDDIDIFMPRPDYEIFLDNYKSEDFKIASPRDKHPLYTFSKLYKTDTMKVEEGFAYKKQKPFGIDIDIFPIDGTDKNDHLINCKKIKKYNFLFQIINQNIKRNSFIKTIISLIIHCLRGKKLCNKIEKIKKRYNYNNCEYVTIFFDFFDQKPINSIIPKSIFEKSIDVEFEGHMYNAPIGYDELLTTIYGDYMTPPPIDKRESNHINRVYIKK